MNQLKKTQLVSTIVIVGFIAGTLFCYILGYYFKLPHPYNCFLGSEAGIFNDFFSARAMTLKMDPFHTVLGSFGNNYPPFGYLITTPFNLIPGAKAVWVYFFTFVAVFWLLLSSSLKGISKENNSWWCFGALALLTYPFQFSLDRLNAENIIFVCVALFYLAYIKNRFKIAAIFLGAAAAAKLYPGLFILIFLAEKRFREVALFFLSLLGFTALALILFKTSLLDIWNAYQRSSPAFLDFTLSASNTNYSSSLFSACQALLAVFKPHHGQDRNVVLRMLFIYIPTAFILLGGSCIAIVRLRMELWQRLAIIATAIIVIPQTSFDYKLMYIFLPLVAFLTTEKVTPNWKIYSALFGLILIPKTFWPLYKIVFINVVINPIVLIVLSILILREVSHKSYSTS